MAVPSAATKSTGDKKTEEAQESSSSAAAASLQLLLREDRLLTQHELQISACSNQVFSYAAALMQQDGGGGSTTNLQSTATQALEDVNRKLALVESLAERVSRTSPQAVAGPLLRLHGYALQREPEESTNSTASTLVATRDRCHRLRRQALVLEGVAKRVESSLQRGLQRMETSTCRLSRVLDLSNVLKQILRLKFESSKLQGYDLDDLRDLTRVAACVSVMQDLLEKPQLKNSNIAVVESMRPQAQQVSTEVRRAAFQLLKQDHHGSPAMVVQLGATLQVYYHLGELPQAAWSAVQHGLDVAQSSMEHLFNSAEIQKLNDKAASLAKAAVGAKHKPGETERFKKTKLRELRAEAASTWATGMVHAAMQVWNLHHVLSRKSDPVTRRVYLSVVAEAPIPKQYSGTDSEFSIFGIFWKKLCDNLGQVIAKVLEDGKIVPHVAGLYPAVRAAALDMLSSLHDTMQAGSLGVSSSLEDAAAASSNVGVLGGSAGLNDAFWTEPTNATLGSVASADTWTRAEIGATNSNNRNDDGVYTNSNTTTTSSLSTIFQSPEWKSLQGITKDNTATGLLPLQEAFLEASSDRLCEPLQYMFPSGIAVDEDGVAISVLPTLPSRYDLQKLDHSIRQELSLADPREGGGELSMTPMIADIIVDMVKSFCNRAKGVVSGVGEGGCLQSNRIVPTENLVHDLKVANVMSALATSLRTAPENTFIVPYKPSTSVQHEEAANMCQTALVPALQEIDKTVNGLIVSPLCRALNRRVASAIAKVHHGTYLSESLDAMEGTGTSFVQKHLAGLYEGIADNILSKLPTEYASIVASIVATYSIYTFVSNISLIRPLGETARLHITQDLADFELALEQLVFKGNSSKTLSQMHHGKPYAELRAVRQMLFWSGLEDTAASAPSLAKSLLREVWIKDLRPSTIIHYLFSFAPPLLSSPHHAKRTSPEDYVVTTLVRLDGSVDDGEASAWMVTMECCDSYQQRESVGDGRGNGDARVANILMNLGPELLRRRRH